MNAISTIIDELASTSKRNEKIAILERNKNNTLLQRVLFYALDPSITFGIEKIPDYNTVVGGLFDRPALSLNYSLDKLDAFVNREVTGNAAIERLSSILSEVTKEDADVLVKIIERDLRCGVGASTVNKVWPELIYVHPYCRCSSLNEKTLAQIKYPAFSQVKMDGMYIDIIVNAGTVTYMSRNGHVLELNSDLYDPYFLKYFEGNVLQGELTVLDNQGDTLLREESNGLINSDDIPFADLRFTLWDMIDFNEFQQKKSTETYEERFSDLEDIIYGAFDHGDIPLQVNVVPTEIVQNFSEAVDHFKECIGGGLEGTLLKSNDMIWANTTSKKAIKMKVIFDIEMQIVAFNEGSGKDKGKLGSFTCQTSDGKIEVGVGTGLKDVERQQFWDEQNELMGAIITVRSNGIMDKYEDKPASLFLPRFVEIRYDKTEADDMPRVQEQYDAAVKSMDLI